MSLPAQRLAPLGADRRALALFRVSLGLLLLWQQLRGWGCETPWCWAEALVLLATLLFIVGWRTRLSHAVLCLGWLAGNPWASGGDLTGIWLVWGFLLPLGDRLSVDGLLASLRWRKEKTPAQLRRLPAPKPEPVRRVAVLGVGVQLALIYALDSRVNSDTGLLLAALIPLLFSPYFTTWARRLVLPLLGGYHLAVNILGHGAGADPLFGWAMLTALLVLLTPADLALLERAVARLAGPRLRIYYDSDCGICHLTARVFVRLDLLRRVEWVGREPEAAIPSDMSQADFDTLREATIIVWAPASNQRWERAAAFARLLRAMPGGLFVWWICLLPGVAGLLDWGYKAFSIRRHRVSAWLGMGACGLAPPEAMPELTEPTEVQRWLTRCVGGVSDLAAAALIIALITAALT